MELARKEIEFVTGYVAAAMLREHEIDVDCDEVRRFTGLALECLDRHPERAVGVAAEMEAELARFLAEIGGA